jgi:REP element-mobilizing transposase RayT
MTMSLTDDRHKAELRAAGWYSRGYLPHFDGKAIPQFLTLHLADSLPKHVVEKWKHELSQIRDEEAKILLQRRIEHYLDRGYGEALLRDEQVATLIQNDLLKYDGDRYRLHAWVVMPNHVHVLLTRSEQTTLSEIMQSFKSYTAHEANRLLGRRGKFWLDDYFDRYIRNAEHYQKAVRYIENNPVKARLCSKPEDWPFSSAWFRVHADN